MAASTRSYNESCALAHSLDLVGERWALLVVRELMFGPRRFTDIQERLSGASSSVLTDRLQRLTESGVVERHRLPPPSASWVYELTEWGAALEPAVLALAQWGRLSPSRSSELSTTPAAVAMSMLVHFDSAKARGLDVGVDFDIDGDRFRVVVSDERLRIGPPDGDSADANVRGSVADVRELIGIGGAPTRDLAAAGVQIEGEADAVAQLLETLTLSAGDGLGALERASVGG
ncbi:winged helix-turn-helix transcriptional regulator [Agromyces sp. NPDC049794]|uniref:winged helix-turn-helix transcriptional regulator n=1 Tax=unclassified Agromyces TaxID=2639701 RepID=UPI0033DF3FEB